MLFRRSFGFAVLAAVLATTACAEVRETVDEASARLDALFGAGSTVDAAGSKGAERVYREGLAERARGDQPTAFTRMFEAAELGHGPAAYEVGLAYKDGRGTARDLAAGARWINTAAERGEARAR